MNAPTDLKKPAYWMPFTNTRQYAQAPKQVVRAEGMYFITEDGRKVIDGLATLWCTNAGHCHPRIVEAMRAQIGELDFCSSFSMGHPKAFQLSPICFFARMKSSMISAMTSSLRLSLGNKPINKF